MSGEPETPEAVAELRRRIAKLDRINAALIQRVERSMDHQANAFSMFQTAIGLEAQVRVRTDELNTTLNRLERANEELVAARDAAERANRFKTRFFTSVGHDLLQPLHAARLSLSAMTDEAGETLPKPPRRLVEQIGHALSSIEELLRTILDLSKLEAGAMKPSLATVQLGTLLKSLAVDMEPIAQSRSLRLTVRASDALVVSDPLMLRRILQNLLANAVRYTERGRILVAARRRGAMMRIEVWDTGPGIAAVERERIFEEFQRGAASERTPSAGFGIGLSIMRRMADSLGHRVELCSEVDRGTRFSVSVPYAGRAVHAGEPAPVAGPGHDPYGFAGARAYVIDNDAAVLRAMKGLLERWGCEARFALGLSGVAGVIEREPDFRPDFVLADYHLDHGQSGLDVVAHLREQFRSEIPAIVITADHTQEVAARIDRASCEILRKPIKPAELRALMMHLRARSASQQGGGAGGSVVELAVGPAGVGENAVEVQPADLDHGLRTRDDVELA